MQRQARSLAVLAALLGSTLATGGARAAVPPDRALFGDYLAASVALEANDDDYAAEHMLRALGADPRNRSLRERAFLAAALAGRPEAKILASGLPGNTAASLLAGNAAVASGQWSDALRLYGAIPHDGGLGDLLRPVLLAWAEGGAGHADAGLQALAPAMGGDRLPAFYALAAGELADWAGRTADAAADYHLAQQASPGLNLALVRTLASFTARTGHIEDATEMVHALVGSLPTLRIAESGIDASLTTRPITDAREGIARAYLAAASLLTAQKEAQPRGGDGAGDAEATTALLMLRFSLALDPGWSETRLVLSDVDDSLHNGQAALDVLAPVRASDPLFALIELRRAELLASLGRDADAGRIYRELMGSFPHEAEPAREYGELLNDGHRYAEAAAALSAAIADTPDPVADDWTLFFDRAIAFDRSREWNRAEADLRHALALSPDQPYVLNYLGYSYAEQNRDLPAARSMLERALEQKPHDGAFLDSLGWIILKQGDVPQAVEQLQEAAELTPEDPTVNYHLGVAYWEAGRRVEAENQWRRALILNPDADDLPKIEAHLREADARSARSPAAAQP